MIRTSSALSAETYTLARFHLDQQKEDDKAIADLNEAIHLDPDDAMAYDFRGYARLRKNDFDGAIADLDRSIRLRPDLAETYRSRGPRWCGRSLRCAALVAVVPPHLKDAASPRQRMAPGHERLEFNPGFVSWYPFHHTFTGDCLTAGGTGSGALADKVESTAAIHGGALIPERLHSWLADFLDR